MAFALVEDMKLLVRSLVAAVALVAPHAVAFTPPQRSRDARIPTLHPARMPTDVQATKPKLCQFR